MDSGSAATVAAHYNDRQTVGFGARRQSPIFRLRNLNNWVKARLIQRACELAGVANGGGAALDLCCGKGGDMFKWRAAGVRRLVCADIAAESVAECKRKFYSMRLDSVGAFVVADCARDLLADLHPEAARELDVASCQFSLHYGFESVERARRLIENAAARLRPGGAFVGTVPDANRIVARARKAGGAFGNAVYRVEPRFDLDAPPLFGAEYFFKLEGVVECPEYLVHFATFERLAAEQGLEPVSTCTFAEFFEQNSEDAEARRLLAKMEALETVRERESHEPGLRHARPAFEAQPDRREPVGTLSRDEWEVAEIYRTFVFRKKAEPVR